MIRLHLILFISTLLLFTFYNAIGQNYMQIKGKVTDVESQTPLCYASVGIQNQHIGTISNENGYFSFFIPDSLMNDTFRVNYLGYKSYTIPVKKIVNKTLKIKLEPSATTISEVIIKPLSPIDVLAKVKQYHCQNLPEESFISKGYYLQEIIENDSPIEFIEAFIDLYYPVSDDTTISHARLIEGRTKENLSEIQFMKRFVEKKAGKQERKAIRKGESIDTVGKKGINVVFGGPKSFVSEDYIRNFKDLIPEKDENRFRYCFEAPTTLQDRELYVIKVTSKGVYKHARVNAMLYIDKKSFALVNTIISYQPVAPILARPLLKIYRIKINELNIKSNIEYKMVNNQWYPNKHIVSGTFNLHKKYSGNYEEISIGSIRKAFVATDIKKTNVHPFPLEERLTEEPLQNQLGEYHPAFWENKNKVPY